MADSTAINFQYGSIIFGNVKTTNYTEETLFDSAGVNVTQVKHRITIQGTLTRGLTPAVGSEVAGDVMAGLRRYLNRSRRYLLYGIGGKKIVEVGSSSSPDNPDLNLDAANGPKCLWVSAINVSETCIIIEASFEAYVVPCSVQDRTILSHVFGQTEEYDRAGYCTLTTNGMIVTRSDILKTPTQILEGVGIPKIRDGYQREGWNFMLMDDGLRFAYQLRDKEFHRRAPDGVATVDSQFVLVTGAGGNGASANFTVTLEGFKEITKQQLYEKGSMMYLSKISSIALLDGTNKPTILSSRVAEDLYRNRIELQFDTLVDQSKVVTGAKGLGAFRSGIFGPNFRPTGKDTPELPVPLNPGQADGREYELRDGQLVDMLRAEFQEPCDALAVVVQTSKRPRSTGELVGGLAGGILDSIIGELQSTDGGAAGGGGIGNVFPPGFIPGESAQPRLFNQDILREFGFTPDVPNLVPLSDYPPSLTERFFPGGAGSEPADPTFSSLGGNTVDNRLLATTADPADIDLPYTSYLVSIGHDYDTGKRGSRGCGPPDSSGRRQPNPIASVGNPTLTLTAVWTAERIGARPQIPDPNSGDENYVLLGARIKPDEVRRMPSGELRYIVTGSYVYFVRRPGDSPILDAYPPFLMGDMVADERAGLGGTGYRTAKGILFARIRTLPAEPFFRDPEDAASPAAAALAVAGTVAAGSLVGGVAGTPEENFAAAGQVGAALGLVSGNPPYNPSPGG